MIISQKRVNNISNIVSSIPAGKDKIRICYSLQNKEADLSKVGFTPDLAQEGDTILPKVIAPISRFNAHGKFISRKDLPKESRFLFQRIWRWKQWEGKNQVEMEKVIDVYRDCYPRDLIPAPHKEFTYHNGCLTSEILEIVDLEGIKHTLNLFLEFFGECEIIYEDFAKIITYSKRKVNWKFLPQGENPWEEIVEHLKRNNISNNSVVGSLIFERQEILKSYKPKDIVLGAAGFHEYLAYVFPNFTLLESIKYGNAIYVFEKNWEEISKLTKAEIISQNLQKERIVHCTGWKEKIKKFVN